MLSNHIKVFFRVMLKNTTFYIITSFGLAVGMTSVFFIALYINYETSFDSFHEGARDIYRINSTSARTPVPLSNALKEDVSGVSTATRMIMSTSGSNLLVKDANDNIVEEVGYYVDSTFFDLFTFTFLSKGVDKLFRQPDEIVLTKSIADKYFPEGGAVGKSIEFVNSYLPLKLFKVSAVIDDVPPNSQFQFGLLIPFVNYGSANYTLNWTTNLVYTFVKLEPSAKSENVLAQVRNILKQKAQEPDENLATIQMQPLRALHFLNATTFDYGPHNKIENIWILSAIAVLLLIIAGINYVNLSTAKAVERLKEVGLRKAIGANRSELIIQHLSESVIMTILSAFIAALVIYLLAPFYQTETGVPFEYALRQWMPYVWTLPLFVIVVGISAGVYPAYVIASVKPAVIVRDHVASSGRGSFRLKLTIVQFGVAAFMVLSTLVIRSQMNFIENSDLGFDKDQIVVLNVGGPGINTRIHTFRSELEKNPNVVNVSASLTLPTDLTYNMPYSITESINANSDSDEVMNLRGLYTDPDFISNLGIEIIQGRTFTEGASIDTLNFILNESAVKLLVSKYGKDWENPLDRPLYYFRTNTDGWFLAKRGKIIGVVKDFHFASLHHTIEPLVMQTDYRLLYKILVKIKPTEIPATISFLESEWKKMNFERPFNFQFLDDRMQNVYAKEQQFLIMFNVFSVIAIVVSCLGLYGLALYSTQQRSREISIRKVLGASSSSLFNLLTITFLKPVFIALVIVWPLAYYFLNTWLEKFAYHETLRISSFIVSGGLCVMVALLTIFFRTWKVIRTNPLKYLKEN